MKTPVDYAVACLSSVDDLPGMLSLDTMARFLHDSLRPYEDELEDIRRGLSYALDNDGDPQGFVLVSMEDGHPTGGAVVHRTPWSGCVPGNLLLYLAVAPAHRGRGLGRFLIDEVVGRCNGDVKLHVEYDNPAMRLYTRAGFKSKYAEMRYAR